MFSSEQPHPNTEQSPQDPEEIAYAVVEKFLISAMKSRIEAKLMQQRRAHDRAIVNKEVELALPTVRQTIKEARRTYQDWIHTNPDQRLTALADLHHYWAAVITELQQPATFTSAVKKLRSPFVLDKLGLSEDSLDAHVDNAAKAQAAELAGVNALTTFKDAWQILLQQHSVELELAEFKTIFADIEAAAKLDTRVLDFITEENL